MKKDRLFFLGDVHGNWRLIRSLVKRFDIKNAYIIQVGDFNLGSRKPASQLELLEFVNERLVEANVILLVIRGNHDDPEPFHNNYKLSNIEFLPDYTVRKLCGKKIMFIGGAVSVDRHERKMEGLKWWEGEEFVLNSDELIKARNIDIVVTHTAPHFVTPIGLNQFVYDKAKQDDLLVGDVLLEREEMTKVYDYLEMNNDITHWYYGHFHRSSVEQFRRTEFRLLNIDELYELDVR